MTPTSLPASTPEEQGMDSAVLAQAIDYLLEERELFNIHSLTIVRKGHVVADVNFFPFHGGYPHKLESLSKVFFSAVMGLAIDKGYIAGVDERVIDFFPNHSISNLDDRKRAITIENLLTYTSGLGGVLPYSEEADELSASGDPVQYALDLPMTAEPGTRWRYANPDVLLISAIITQATGMKAYDFAKAHMLRRLGIVSSKWESDPGGYTGLSGYFTPQGLALFGQLFLQDGMWDGHQILSESWIATSTTPQILESPYIWGRYPEYFWGGGADGQRLIVAPLYDIVAVFTGGGYNHQDIERIYREALYTYVFPAVLSAGVLPPNPAGTALLDDAISRAGSFGREPEPVGALPAMAHQVSGRTYVMHVPYGYLHMTLSFPANDEARLGVESSPEWVEGSPFEFAAGLDGIERFARGRNGIPAAGTGEWLSENTFMMDVDQLGNLDATRLIFEFEDQSVTLTQEDAYWFEPGPPIVLTGTAQD